MWLDNAFVTDGDELLSETLKYVLHKATLAAIGEDLSNEVDKALNVYFTEEMASQSRKPIVIGTPMPDTLLQF